MGKINKRLRGRDTLIFVRVVLNKLGTPDRDHADHICVRDGDRMVVIDSPVGLSVLIWTSEPEATPVFHYDKAATAIQLYEPGPWERVLRRLARPSLNQREKRG